MWKLWPAERLFSQKGPSWMFVSVSNTPFYWLIDRNAEIKLHFFIFQDVTLQLQRIRCKPVDLRNVIWKSCNFRFSYCTVINLHILNVVYFMRKSFYFDGAIEISVFVKLTFYWHLKEFGMFSTFFVFIFMRNSLIIDSTVKNQSCPNGIFVRCCLTLNFWIWSKWRKSFWYLI